MVYQHTVLVQLVHSIMCINLEINGEITFDLKLRNTDFDENNGGFRQIDRKLKTADNEQSRTTTSRDSRMLLRNVTAAPMMECVYQYPGREQINAMLSHMMNQLTKMFIRAYELVQEADNTKKQDTRFKIISKKDTDFFEGIYNNMTEEYGIFYNKMAARVNRSGRDPCRHQEEIKDIWKELLEKSLSSLRRAALHCVEKYLRAQHIKTDLVTVNKLKKYLMAELGEAHSRQLDVLCDNFQLCFNELL